MSLHPSTSAPAARCGCCGSARCHGDCTCASGDETCGNSGIARPQFFAGQLLTEEDLDGITRYVVDKNALHNRHLHGDGVVCGLEVTVDPCKPRVVHVAPGHALDCCGNDIVVPCRVEGLDIIRMIQELRKGLRGGYDCGDPCGQKKADPSNGNRNGTKEEIPQKYHLYVKYCEAADDFVSPYETETCASPGTGCQPSRWREGYQFELACPPTDAGEEPTLRSRLLECFKNIGAANLPGKAVRGMGTLEAGYRAVVQAKQLAADLIKGEEPGPAKRKELLDTLDRSLTELGRDAEQALLDEPEARELFQLTHQVLVLAFRTKLVPSDQIAPFNLVLGKVPSTVEKALTKLTEFARTSDDFQKEVKVLDGRRAEWAKTPEAGGWRQGDSATTFVRKTWITGEMVSLAEVNEQLKELEEVRDEVERRVTDGAVALEPVLRRRLHDLAFPEVADRVEADTFYPAWQTALVLGRILFALQSHCFCEALLPPCLTCDDTRVLLATLEVDLKECRVVTACNLARRFVLAGPTLRYWFGFVDEWFDTFRQICCPPHAERKVIAGPDADHDKKLREDWERAAMNVAEWRPSPADAKVTPLDLQWEKDPEKLKAVRREVMLKLGELGRVTGRGGDDLHTLIRGLEPFDETFRTDTPETLVKEVHQLRETVDRLTRRVEELPAASQVDQLGDRVNGLEDKLQNLATAAAVKELGDKVKAVETRLDELSRLGPPEQFSLDEHWRHIATASNPVKKAFLKSRIRSRLTQTGVDQLLSEEGSKNLAKVMAGQMNFLPQTEQVRQRLVDVNVKDLLSAQNPIELLTPSDREDLANQESILAAQKRAEELNALVERWPEEKFTAQDLS